MVFEPFRISTHLRNSEFLSRAPRQVKEAGEFLVALAIGDAFEIRLRADRHLQIDPFAFQCFQQRRDARFNVGLFMVHLANKD